MIYIKTLKYITILIFLSACTLQKTYRINYNDIRLYHNPVYDLKEWQNKKITLIPILKGKNSQLNPTQFEQVFIKNWNFYKLYKITPLYQNSNEKSTSGVQKIFNMLQTKYSRDKQLNIKILNKYSYQLNCDYLFIPTLEYEQTVINSYRKQGEKSLCKASIKLYVYNVTENKIVFSEKYSKNSFFYYDTFESTNFKKNNEKIMKEKLNKKYKKSINSFDKSDNELSKFVGAIKVVKDTINYPKKYNKISEDNKIWSKTYTSYSEIFSYEIYPLVISNLVIKIKNNYKGKTDSGNCINGIGSYTFLDGYTYEGQWEKNKASGKGVLKNKNGSIIKKGFWENGFYKKQKRN